MVVVVSTYIEFSRVGGTVSHLLSDILIPPWRDNCGNQLKKPLDSDLLSGSGLMMTDC